MYGEGGRNVAGCGVLWWLIALPTPLTGPSSGWSIDLAMPLYLTCGSLKVWRMLLIGPHGTPALYSSASQWALGLVLVTSASAALSAWRFFERAGGVL